MHRAFEEARSEDYVGPAKAEVQAEFCGCGAALTVGWRWLRDRRRGGGLVVREGVGVRVFDAQEAGGSGSAG